MAYVRAERVDLRLVAVERERVEAPSVLDPERLVEALAQLVGLALQPVRQLAVAPDVARELGDAPLRVVDVTLHLTRRDRRLRQRAVVKALRVPRVLPRLVLEPVLSTPLSLHAPVPFPAALLLPPLHR